MNTGEHAQDKPLIFKEILIPGEGADERTIVFMHGMGADLNDFVPIANYLNVPGRWIFPQAPAELFTWGRWAWFPFSMEDQEQVMSDLSYFTRMAGLDIPDVDRSLALIEQLIEEQQVDVSQLYIGGFSQGAIMSAEFVRARMTAGKALPKAVLLLSGALVNGPRWKDAKLPEGVEAPAVFQTHGRFDDVLPLATGTALREAVEATGLRVQYHEFIGGHTLLQPELVKLQYFLVNDGHDADATASSEPAGAAESTPAEGASDRG